MEDSDIKGIVVKANVTEGESISAPAGIEPTDLSDKSAEEIGEIFESMIGQLSSVISGMFLPF